MEFSTQLPCYAPLPGRYGRGLRIRALDGINFMSPLIIYGPIEYNENRIRPSTWFN
jgi:hypothetical protein